MINGREDQRSKSLPSLLSLTLIFILLSTFKINCQLLILLFTYFIWNESSIILVWVVFDVTQAQAGWWKPPLKLQQGQRRAFGHTVPHCCTVDCASTGSEGLWSPCRTCSPMSCCALLCGPHLLFYSACTWSRLIEGGLHPGYLHQAKPPIQVLTIRGSRENMNSSSFHARVWCWSRAQISIRSNRDFHCWPSMALNGPSSPQVRFIHRRRFDTSLQPWIWPHSSGSNVFQTSERAFVRMCVFGKG